ncbi:aminotransferase class V-fold PLP-dependent enzyme [Euzebya tangerina]|uniref:aminotransferase class V-fold PLP-dependent enzyme n=1 Tax=Euzebya tangerina TaxID=591198 RepID=UPI000E30B5F1|nr:aminotransferase class V-fold PLP-dependent enzyme [Euzebya tangerina]
MDVAEAQSLFRPDGYYLNSATVGIPPTASLDAMKRDMADWAAGRLDPVGYDEVVHQARRAFARLAQTSAERVGIISQASVAAGVAATALRPGDTVLLAEEDFTSVLFPFLQLESHGVHVVTVPLESIVDRIDDTTTMVAVSAAQSADGRVTDLDALAGAADAHEVLTFVDATQAASWLPLGADRFSITVAGAYKWLCCPRGSGFMTVDPAIADRVTPVAAGWYAGEDVWDSIYGPPLRLAEDGRRFDLSPAWLCWVGAVPALDLLADVGVATINAHNLGLANQTLEALGSEPSNSAIISLDRPGAVDALQSAGVACAGRGGRTRLSFHLYNTEDDVDRVVDLLSNLPGPRQTSGSGR